MTIPTPSPIILDWESMVHDTDGFASRGSQPARLSVAADTGITA